MYKNERDDFTLGYYHRTPKPITVTATLGPRGSAGTMEVFGNKFPRSVQCSEVNARAAYKKFQGVSYIFNNYTPCITCAKHITTKDMKQRKKDSKFPAIRVLTQYMLDPSTARYDERVDQIENKEHRTKVKDKIPKIHSAIEATQMLYHKFDDKTMIRSWKYTDIMIFLTKVCTMKKYLNTAHNRRIQAQQTSLTINCRDIGEQLTNKALKSYCKTTCSFFSDRNTGKKLINERSNYVDELLDIIFTDKGNENFKETNRKIKSLLAEEFRWNFPNRYYWDKYYDREYQVLNKCLEQGSYSVLEIKNMYKNR